MQTMQTFLVKSLIINQNLVCKWFAKFAMGIFNIKHKCKPCKPQKNAFIYLCIKVLSSFFVKTRFAMLFLYFPYVARVIAIWFARFARFAATDTYILTEKF